MCESPHEKTTLLAKCKREAAQPSDEHSNSDSEALLGQNDSAIDANEAESVKCRYFLIEPMLLLLMFGYNFSATILQNQIIYQTCTAIFNFDEYDCKQLGTSNSSHSHIKKIEQTIQPYVARILMTSHLVDGIVPVVFGSFVGIWSDIIGRKPLLVAAYTGYSIYYIIICTLAYLSMHTAISPWYYLLANLPHALLGGTATYTVAAFCYISDTSSARIKPYRMAFYEICIYIGLMLGSFSAGYAFERINKAYIIFSISAAVLILATLIIVFCVPESLVIQQNVERKLFDWKVLPEMWSVSFKRRSMADRSILWCTLLTLLLCKFSVDGSINVFYLFIRQQFNWTLKHFTTYETIGMLVPIICNFLGMLLLRRYLKISLIPLAIIALLSHAVSCLMKAFAVLEWQLYAGIALGALKSIANPMCRTIITNLVPPHELGKILSFLSVLQSLTPFLAAPTYTLLYSLTYLSFPGFFNFLNANIFLLAICLMLFSWRCKQKYANHYKPLLS